MRAALIASAGLLAGAAYYYATQRQNIERTSGTTWGDTWDQWSDTAAQAVDTITDTIGDFMNLRLILSNMRHVTAADVAHPNVQAFLRVIRRGEGTADPDGYRRMFGGKLFDSFADHPRQVQTFTLRSGGTLRSSAAGAYQFLASTWDETARIMGLADFSPPNQDRAAVGRLAARQALEDVKAGRFEAAIAKTAREWASLPGSPYGQPVITMNTAKAVYTANGGTFA